MALVPLTRDKFEELIPLYATGGQYLYCWGKFQDFLKQLLISVIAVAAIAFLGGFLSPALQLTLGIVGALYWLWIPIAKAGIRNSRYRKYRYSGFWQGKVLDVYVTEELLGTEETANQRGELVIVENRERRLNLEIGDRTGFSTSLQVPLKRNHQYIKRGTVVQTIVMSSQPDLSYIAEIGEIYVPSRNIWVGDYPCLRRDVFVDMAGQLRNSQGGRRSSRQASYPTPDRQRRTRSPIEESYPE
ncbi:MAG: phosphate ABC transporter permease [Cyanobacteriota bacterium]|nr:phosphate ABC transporter permease [Cyanobacteriota bacterium]